MIHVGHQPRLFYIFVRFLCHGTPELCSPSSAFIIPGWPPAPPHPCPLPADGGLEHPQPCSELTVSPLLQQPVKLSNPRSVSACSRSQYSLSAQPRDTVTLHRFMIFCRRWHSSVLSSSLFPEICPTSHRDEVEYEAAGGKTVLGDGQIMGTAGNARVRRELEVSWGKWERRDSVMEVGHHFCSRLLHMWLSRWWSTRRRRVPTPQLKQKQGQRSSQQASEKWDAEPCNITRTFPVAHHWVVTNLLTTGRSRDNNEPTAFIQHLVFEALSSLIKLKLNTLTILDQILNVVLVHSFSNFTDGPRMMQYCSKPQGSVLDAIRESFNFMHKYLCAKHPSSLSRLSVTRLNI